MNRCCRQLTWQLSQVSFALVSSACAAAPPAQHHPPVRHVVAQKALARTTINKKDGAVMIRIPAGPFQMGDDDQIDNPRHTVTLSGYYIYKNLVTVRMYRKYCAETGKHMPDAPDFDRNWKQDDHPIVNVTWDDAQAYCQWAGCRLPTEAQWEKAARGVRGLKFPWGNNFSPSKLWCSKRVILDAGGTAAVGKYGISPYGVTDMGGNAWQWCADWYDHSFWRSRAADRLDPVNLSAGEKVWRVVRGGSWGSYVASNFRCSYRGNFGYRFLGAAGRYFFLGFRCVRRPDSN